MHNINKLIILLFLSSSITIACAKENRAQEEPLKVKEYAYYDNIPVTGHFYVLQDLAVLVAKENTETEGLQVSYFTNGTLYQDDIIVKFVWMMDAARVKKDIVDRAKDFLLSGNRVRGGKFDIEYTDPSGSVHRFELFRTGRNKLYVLTYQSF